MLVYPEGAALLAGLKRLLRSKQINGDEKILLLNIRSNYKYLETLNCGDPKQIKTIRNTRTRRTKI